MMHRPRWVAGVGVVVAGLALFGGSAVARHGGGDTGPVLNDVVVNKVVTGAVPAGTEFKVYVDCIRAKGGEEEAGTLAHGEPGSQLTEAEILFAADGTPKTLNNITVGPGSVSCQVTETITGGAESTEYACEVTDPGTPGEEPAPLQEGATCALGGDAPVTVTFRGVRNAAAVVTVTNHFPELQVVPEMVVVQPRFTG